MTNIQNIIDNCEVCGDLFTADRENYAPVCNKAKCRKEHRTEINTSTRSRALENFSGACDDAAIELQEFAKNAKKCAEK